MLQITLLKTLQVLFSGRPEPKQRPQSRPPTAPNAVCLRVSGRGSRPCKKGAASTALTTNQSQSQAAHITAHRGGELTERNKSAGF